MTETRAAHDPTGKANERRISYISRINAYHVNEAERNNPSYFRITTSQLRLSENSSYLSINALSAPPELSHHLLRCLRGPFNTIPRPMRVPAANTLSRPGSCRRYLQACIHAMHATAPGHLAPAMRATTRSGRQCSRCCAGTRSACGSPGARRAPPPPRSRHGAANAAAGKPPRAP